MWRMKATGTMRPTALAALVVLASAALAADDLYVYPDRGQTAEQLDRDKEACHEWAVKQTGVDPVKMAESPPKPETPPGPGGVLGGAGLGAARGAAEGDAAGGAVHGLGVAGLVRVVRARRQMQQQHDAYVDVHAKQEKQLDDYDRAYGACLGGRGYTVR